MRRIHLIIGLLGVSVFLLTGEVMKHQHPRMEELSPEVRMMFLFFFLVILVLTSAELFMDGVFGSESPEG